MQRAASGVPVLSRWDGNGGKSMHQHVFDALLSAMQQEKIAPQRAQVLMLLPFVLLSISFHSEQMYFSSFMKRPCHSGYHSEKRMATNVTICHRARIE
jgi:hypothetical protein